MVPRSTVQAVLTHRGEKKGMHTTVCVPSFLFNEYIRTALLTWCGYVYVCVVYMMYILNSYHRR